MSTTVSRETKITSLPSLDFIAGIVEVHGNFFWEKLSKRRSPVFRIKIQDNQSHLLHLIKEKLRLTSRIYTYRHEHRKYSMLVVRKKVEIGQKLIPALEERLWGAQKKIFEKWRDKFQRQMLRKQYLRK